MAQSIEAFRLAQLDACAREPIHIIGQVQSHGILFGLSEQDLIVRQVSANVEPLLGIAAEELCGRSFDTVLDAPQFEAFRALVRTNDLLAPDPIRMVVGNSALDMNCVVHRQDGVLIVELELMRGAHSLEPINVGAHLRMPLLRMEQASSVLELAQVTATDIRRLSGFDRAMVYRFDEAWNGEVIAETVSPGSISYLGLRFPASDIPAQARRLFLLNHLRVIADAGSEPVPIIPNLNPITGRPLDLTRSGLRSASPVHIEYLKNMRVGSSMTISIIVERRLWGLIACHDPAPHIVDSATRSVCELLGEMLASQISLRIDNAELKLRLITRKLLEKCMAAIEASKSLAAAEPSVCTQLMDLFDADGLVWRSDDVVISYGTAVEEEKLQPVVTKMRKLASRGVATSNMLSALDRSGETYSGSVSGALYIGLSDWTGDYLLLMRRELVETVRWAGNPEKAVSSEAGGALHPRTSFAAWQETVRRRSRPWTELELEHAHVVREQLARLGEARRLRKFEERVRYLAHHDALTGLFNRDSINLKLEQCVNDAVADGIPFNVLFVDIDRFRYFNDRLGHAAGDEILKTLAARMTKLARSEDLVGRLGNDEFVVIVPGLSPSEAHATGLRILRGIEEPLGLEADPELKITASIGQSGYPADGTSGEVLVGRAYMAMFRTKQTGGNGLAAFTESQDQA